MVNQARVNATEVHNEFVESLSSVFAPLKANWIHGPALESIWDRHKAKDRGKPKAVWDDAENSVIAFLYSTDGPPIGGAAVKLEFSLDDDRHCVYFARVFSGVFNADAALFHDRLTMSEHWRVSSTHRFERAIARFVNFQSHSASEWLALMQASLSLTYEQNSVRHTVMFVKKGEPLRRFKQYYVPFQGAIPLREALIEQKWVRAVIDGQRAILVGNQHGNIVGILSLDALAYESSISVESLPAFAPHVSLLPLQLVLNESDMAFITAPTGDLYVMTGRNAMFHKTQGQWHLVGIEQTQLALEAHMTKELVVAFLRTLLDLSYERRGALLCVLDQANDVSVLIPDHKAPETNVPLRKALRKRDLLRWADRQIIAAAAGTDGATILSSTGKVHDVACLVNPTESRWQSFGHSVARAFPGSRSAVAWKASFFGIAAKVSDDGPVEIFYQGKLIGALR